MPSSPEIQFEETRRSFEATHARARALRRHASELGRQVCEARDALANAVQTSVQIQRSMGIPRAASRAEPAVEPTPPKRSAVLTATAATVLDAIADPDDLIEDVIAAYHDAVAQDDERLVALLGGMLREIGRHFAKQIGPKAAGALSS